MKGVSNNPAGRPVTLPKIPCKNCGQIFQQKQHDRFYCSSACGNGGKWSRYPHPKGMTGHKHTEENKKLYAEHSRQRMANDKKFREKSITAMRKGREEQLRLGGSPTKHFTRGKGGKRADLNNQYFRSSWEANYARWLNYLIGTGEIESWQYEPKTFEFPTDAGAKFYTPDFLVKKTNEYEWHEVKGWLTEQGKEKLKRFALFYPNEKLILIDQQAYSEIKLQAKETLENWEKK